MDSRVERTSSTPNEVIETVLGQFEDLKMQVERAINEDRAQAIETRQMLIDRWGNDELPSEDAAMEREINNAQKNVIVATDKIPKILEAMAKIVGTLVKERAFMAMTQGFREIDMSDANSRLEQLKVLQQAKEVKQLDSKIEQTFRPER